MTQCFKDHPSDTQNLNENTKPLDECKSEIMELYGVEMMVKRVPILTCDCLWRIYQREAEEIVAPGGVLIADPKERNRAINAAYARLWLHDSRFQWAGLAAFASKQVGCGLLHASESIEGIEAEFRAVTDFLDALSVPDLSQVTSFDTFKEVTVDKVEALVRAFDEYQKANARNPIPVDIRLAGEKLGLFQQQFQYVYDMMALGNTTLFLDIFPLHAFYAKRGFAELKKCLKIRESIFGHPKSPVFWPVAQDRVIFGFAHRQILQAFGAIEEGDIAESVELFAIHEQQNILQPAIYEDLRLILLLRGNQFSFATDFPSGAAQAIELTLTGQCQRVQDGRTIEFSDDVFADLSDIDQRMEFVLRAAASFNQMLNSTHRHLLEHSIREISSIGVVQ